MRFIRHNTGPFVDTDGAVEVVLSEGYDDHIETVVLFRMLGRFLEKLYDADVLTKHDVADVIGGGFLPEESK